MRLINSSHEKWDCLLERTHKTNELNNLETTFLKSRIKEQKVSLDY